MVLAGPIHGWPICYVPYMAAGHSLESHQWFMDHPGPSGSVIFCLNISAPK
jgi:hypothetical protein